MAIEKLPVRTADAHLNVTPFVEPPHCNHCLSIGKPQVQPDGTIKLKVTLRHPFPYQPQYTGFDVRGTIMFPATRFWVSEEGGVVARYDYWVYDYVPLYFSRAEDGGGQLLNADGYTFFLWPGLDLGPEFQLPIYNYSKGNYANGPDPDSTVNGYKLFTKDPERRMFQITDIITRTYHIAPPDGEFIFGYVVDASWAQPTVTPVTDPKNDFPFWANAEDGYVIESEQLAPFKLGNYYFPNGSYDLACITVSTYPEIANWSGHPVAYAWLMCPGIREPDAKGWPVATGKYEMKEETPGVFSMVVEPHQGYYEGTPGEKYLAIFMVMNHLTFCDYDFPYQTAAPLYFDFFYLEVAEGDG